MFLRRRVCQISFLIKAVHGAADQHLGLVDWEHVEIHENLRQMILRTRGADGSCGCTHDRGRFAVPGAVAVGTRSPVNCIFQYTSIVFRRNKQNSIASRIRLFNSVTLAGGFCSSSWLNGGMSSSSNVSTVAPFGASSVAARSAARLYDPRRRLPAIPRIRIGVFFCTAVEENRLSLRRFFCRSPQKFFTEGNEGNKGCDRQRDLLRSLRCLLFASFAG
jgi:hypothetical protein